MFNFFARLGKKPWANLIMPGLVQIYAFGYLGFQQYGHSIATNLFAAHSSFGKREEMSEELQKMCMETFDDLKDNYSTPVLNNHGFFLKPSPIKWFMTASLEPMVFGMSETKTGVLIGLPSYYNYTKEEEIPENLFEIKRYRLFKNLFSSKNKEAGKSDVEETKKEEENILSDVKSGNEREQVLRIDKESQAGQDFISSLLLSEKAKKYSIAKHIHAGDSYRAGFYALFIMVNGIFTILVARGAVAFFNVTKVHLGQRIPYYVVSGSFYLGNQNYIGGMINTNYEKKAETRTLALGQLYAEGAEEYKSKTELRNKVLSSYLS